MADEENRGQFTDVEKLAIAAEAIGRLIDAVEKQESSISLLLEHVCCLVDQLDRLKEALQSFRVPAPDDLGTLYPLDQRRQAEILIASQRTHGKSVSDFLVKVAEGKITEEMVAEEWARREG